MLPSDYLVVKLISIQKKGGALTSENLKYLHKIIEESRCITEIEDEESKMRFAMFISMQASFDEVTEDLSTQAKQLANDILKLESGELYEKMIDEVSILLESAIRAGSINKVRALLGTNLASPHTLFDSGMSAIGLALFLDNCEDILLWLLSEISDPYDSIANSSVRNEEIEFDAMENKWVNTYDDRSIVSVILEKQSPHLAKTILTHSAITGDHQKALAKIAQVKIGKHAEQLLSEKRRVFLDKVAVCVTESQKQHCLQHSSIMGRTLCCEELDTVIFQHFFQNGLKEKVAVLPTLTFEALNVKNFEKVAQGADVDYRFYVRYSASGADITREITLNTKSDYLIVPLNINRNHYVVLLLSFTQNGEVETFAFIDPMPSTPFTDSNFNQVILPELSRRFPGVYINRINLMQLDVIYCADYIYTLIGKMIKDSTCRKHPETFEGFALDYTECVAVRRKMCQSLGNDFLRKLGYDDHRFISFSTFVLAQSLEEKQAFGKTLERMYKIRCMQELEFIRQNMMQQFGGMLQQRGQEGYDKKTLLVNLSAVAENTYIMCFHISCNGYDEAKLIAVVINQFLMSRRIPSHIGPGSSFNIQYFKNEVNTGSRVNIRFILTVEECYQIQHRQPEPISAETLTLLRSSNPGLIAHQSSTGKKTLLADNDATLKILVATELGLGNGNLMFINRLLSTLSSIQGICVHAIIASNHIPFCAELHDTDSLQVTVVDTLRNSLELILAAEYADLIIGAPNTFILTEHLDGCKFAGTGFLSKREVHILMEYHAEPFQKYNDMGDIKINFIRTGFTVSGNSESLGIFKPSLLPRDMSLAEQRAKLSSDQMLAHIFKTNHEAPVYFAYTCTLRLGSITKVHALTTEQTFVIFVAHIMRRNTKAKIVMPISQRVLMQARSNYPQIFEGLEVDCGGGVVGRNMRLYSNNIEIEIYNPFPLRNALFRALTNYAVLCNTPIAITGDQSLMEVFFCSTSELIFLYQILEHKKGVADALLSLCEKNSLANLVALFSLIRNFLKAPIETVTSSESTQEGSICTERSIIQCVDMLCEKEQELRKETSNLVKLIHKMPDLCESMRGFVNKAQQNSKISTDIRQRTACFFSSRGKQPHAQDQVDSKPDKKKICRVAMS